MKKIKEIRIQNFKAFSDIQVFKLEGKNLLLFGENGAGKSSLYWALYTFLQSSGKKQSDVDEYFVPYHDRRKETYRSLRNVNIIDNHKESFIEIEQQDGTKLKLGNTHYYTDAEKDVVKLMDKASDFIHYKLLLNFYHSTHKHDINLWDVFKRDIFPFFDYSNTEKLSERLDSILDGTIYDGRKKEYTAFCNKVSRFNNKITEWLEKIRVKANEVLRNYFDTKNITIHLSYDILLIVNSNATINTPRIKLSVEYTGTRVVHHHRPQSFLNEAILSQIALSIRLGALLTRPSDESKILVLDDLLLSFDMDNRDKVLDIFLQKKEEVNANGDIEDKNPFSKFQIFFFTHDKGLNYFVGEKIKQHKRQDSWIESEIYASGKEIDSAGRVVRDYPKPILIDGYLDELGKAKSYLNTKKDYTAAALYVRKALERTISECLPLELVYTIKGEQRGLAMLWEEFLKCYTVPQDKIDLLSQSRSMILNPQAHYNFMSLPVYYSELNRAIELVEFIQNNITCSKPIVLLSKGMVLTFTHPSENYSFTLELLGDFLLGQLGDSSKLIYPKCKILSWQYVNTAFWDFIKGVALNQQEIERIKNRKDHLNDIFSNLKKIGQLSIDADMIKKYTKIDNGLWILEEVLDKAGVSI